MSPPHPPPHLVEAEEAEQEGDGQLARRPPQPVAQVGGRRRGGVQRQQPTTSHTAVTQQTRQMGSVHVSEGAAAACASQPQRGWGVVLPVVDADVVEEEDQQPARPQKQHHVAQPAEDLPHI